MHTFSDEGEGRIVKFVCGEFEFALTKKKAVCIGRRGVYVGMYRKEKRVYVCYVCGDADVGTDFYLSAPTLARTSTRPSRTSTCSGAVCLVRMRVYVMSTCGWDSS